MTRFELHTFLDIVPLGTIALSAAIAIIAIVALVPLARSTGWIDRPSVRKVHEGEIPLVGGWAIFAAMLLTQLMGSMDDMAPSGYWTGAVLLFMVALVDDRYPIRARYRFAVQFVAAVAGVSMGGQELKDLGDLLGTGRLDAWWLVVPVSILGTIAVINAVNFSDGADGLCGGLACTSVFWLVAAIGSAAASASAADHPAQAHAGGLLPLACAALGALLAFLFFNMRAPWRGKAVIFLGDSGSMLLGFTLAWLAIQATTAQGPYSVPPVVCLWIMAVPLADAASCIVRRIMAGVTPMTPDLRHLHHLVRRSGMSVGRSVVSIVTGSFVCGLVGVGGWTLGIEDQWMFAGFLASLLGFVAWTNLAWRRVDGKSLIVRATA
jgi:UDP-GlcNAc:undecaprenyl-phosphate GlcNAc-1-phosphate transferase